MDQDKLENTLQIFLKKYHDSSKPVLLALSGGPDSLALLYLLLQYQKRNPLNLHVAHVDHGWRKESEEEARVLQKLTNDLELPWHFRKLSIDLSKGNLEATCRDERLEFFASICQTFQCQAVLLAHHADDQAETVLKRVLEGASLPYLSGLLENSTIQNLVLWRPFLKVNKKDILNWLDNQGLRGFDDKTNRDFRYLRARLRTTIIPNLSEIFGKEIGLNLCRLSDEAKELRDYITEKVQPYLKKKLKGKNGGCLDLSQEVFSSFYEIKHLLRLFFRDEGLDVSYETINLISRLLIEAKANRKVLFKNDVVFIDRRRLFAFKKEHIPRILGEMMPLSSFEHRAAGIGFSYGSWFVKVRSCNDQNKSSTNWKNVWMGHSSLILPEGNYFVGPPDFRASYQKHSTLDKWWTNHKIPAFFRQWCPVIWDQERQIMGEFLTGKTRIKQEPVSKWIQIDMVLNVDDETVM